jgi:hypothetical protein
MLRYPVSDVFHPAGRISAEGSICDQAADHLLLP